MTNIFKKYCAGVYCIESENHDLKHGDECTVTTRYGKEVTCTIWKKLFTSKEGKTYYSYAREDGMNRQNFLLRKAEKREQWAKSAEKKSDYFYERSNKDSDFLSLGEPIKVGHHSERRHRKIIHEAHENMRKCVEQSKKAEEHARKGEALKLIATVTIAMDCPTCLEALEEKVKRLEAEKEAIKQNENRKHYELPYINKNIRDTKKRLETAEKLWKI